MAKAVQEAETCRIIDRPDPKEIARNRFLNFFYEAESVIRILEIYKSGKKPKTCLEFLNDENMGGPLLVKVFEVLIPKSYYWYTEDEEKITKALESIKKGEYNKVPKESLKPMLEAVERQIESFTEFWADQRRRGY